MGQDAGGSRSDSGSMGSGGMRIGGGLLAVIIIILLIWLLF
jgi:hypothetical protein